MTRDNNPTESILSRLSAKGCGCRRLEQSTDCDSFSHSTGLAGFLWLPRPLPAGQSVHLASSRLGRTPESFPAWFDGLRTFAASIDRQTTFLLTAHGTTTDPFLRRIGQLYGIPVVRIALLPNKISDHWIQQQTSNEGSVPTIWFHPASGTTTPTVDELLIGIAHEVRVLRVSARGTIQRCVAARLEHNVDRTWLLINDELSKSKITQALVDAGATAWWLYGTGQAHAHCDALTTSASRPLAAPILSTNDINTADYVLHCTRRRVGRWPDQHETDFLDDLIFRQPGSDHQQLASLCRILATERLVATAELTRSSTPVVCFADVPLDQLASHRTFRKHLSRWDFEPYGIAFRRERLEALGARPVIYGEDETWEWLSAEDRPFFQLATSKDGQVDWRSEQEWRVCGDLTLNQVAATDAVVFVPTAAEAETAAAISKWPVVVLKPEP